MKFSSARVLSRKVREFQMPVIPHSSANGAANSPTSFRSSLRWTCCVLQQSFPICARALKVTNTSVIMAFNKATGFIAAVIAVIAFMALSGSASAVDAVESSCKRLGWVAGYGKGNVCANSVSPSGRCSGYLPFQQAFDYCEATFGSGARLCTLEELRAGEATETGCGYDEVMTWTSTACGQRAVYQTYGSPVYG